LGRHYCWAGLGAVPPRSSSNNLILPTGNTNFFASLPQKQFLFPAAQVGELIIAAAAKNGGDLTPAQLKRLQLAREEKLCVMLAALLRRWVEEDFQGFKVCEGMVIFARWGGAFRATLDPEP
jgi:hypothetical protein